MIYAIFLLLIISTHFCNGMELTEIIDKKLSNPEYFVSHLDKKSEQIEKNIKSNNAQKRKLGYDAEFLVLFKKSIPEIQQNIITLMLKTINSEMHFPVNFFKVPILDSLQFYKSYEILKKIELKNFLRFTDTLTLKQKIDFCSNNYCDIDIIHTLTEKYTPPSPLLWSKSQLISLKQIALHLTLNNDHINRVNYNYRNAYTLSNLYKDLSKSIGEEIVILIPVLSFYFANYIFKHYCTMEIQPDLVEQNMINNEINEFLQEKYTLTGDPIWIQNLKIIVDVFEYSNFDIFKGSLPIFVLPFIMSLICTSNERNTPIRVAIVISAVICNALAISIPLFLTDIIGCYDAAIHYYPWINAILSTIIIFPLLIRMYNLQKTKSDYLEVCKKSFINNLEELLKRKDIVIENS